MSYDLYLFSPRLSHEAFARYFSGRPHFQETGWYANDDTGVYFNFEFVEPKAEEEADSETPEFLRGTHVAFNLNYYRPHVFGLEAEPQVTALVSEFGCAIQDPQMDGMGDGRYSPEGFLRGWNKGNAFGYNALGGGDAGDVLIVDDPLIERTWRWNMQRNALQPNDHEEHFLPRVNWAKRLSDRKPITYAIWGEGVATAFPEWATHVLLVREPRPGVASLLSKKKNGLEVKLVPIGEIAAISGCEWHESPAGRVLLAPAAIPPSRAVIAAFGGRFSGIEKVATPIALDHVLNASLMAAKK